MRCVPALPLLLLMVLSSTPLAAAEPATSWRNGWGLARARSSAAAEPVYRLPFDAGRFTVGQPPQGRFSHNAADSRHAVDFTLPEGTPVLAARAGRVIDLQASFSDAGQDPLHDPMRANYVRIRHADGSMALYAHLLQDGVRVRLQQWVEAGQTIALSGNTGYSTAPHLHFVVQQQQGNALISIPVRIVTPRGTLHYAQAVEAE